MLGLFQVVQSAGAWPGVHSMPKRVMVPKPMEIPLHSRPRLPHASPDGEARPEIGRSAADTGTVGRLQGELGGGGVGFRGRGSANRSYRTYTSYGTSGRTPQPGSDVHRLPGGYRLAFLVAHDQCVPCELAAEKFRHLARRRRVGRSLNLRYEGCHVAAGLSRQRGRFDQAWLDPRQRASAAFVDQCRLLQVQLVSVDKWPAAHRQGAARTGDGRAAWAVVVA